MASYLRGIADALADGLDAVTWSIVSTTVDEATCRWVPPVQRPEGGDQYRWDEESGGWVAA